MRVKDQHAEAIGRALFMREPKVPKGEPPQQPICILNIVLPDDIVSETVSLTDTDSLKPFLKENYDYCQPDPRLADLSNLLGKDWVPLAAHLGLTTSEINVIKSEYPDSVAKQAQSMLRMWIAQSGNKAHSNTLENALKRIGRGDIIPQCLNVEHVDTIQKEYKPGKEDIDLSLSNRGAKKDSETTESLIQAENDVENYKKQKSYDKYSAEEKEIEEPPDEEDFNKTVTERREQIEKRLSVDRAIPASSQRVEIVQEISSIKRQSFVENKISEVEKIQKITQTTAKAEPLKTTSLTESEERQEGGATTTTGINETCIEAKPQVGVTHSLLEDRRDSELLEGVTHILEMKRPIPKLIESDGKCVFPYLGFFKYRCHCVHSKLKTIHNILK